MQQQRPDLFCWDLGCTCQPQAHSTFRIVRKTTVNSNNENCVLFSPLGAGPCGDLWQLARNEPNGADANNRSIPYLVIRLFQVHYNLPSGSSESGITADNKKIYVSRMKMKRNINVFYYFYHGLILRIEAQGCNWLVILILR